VFALAFTLAARADTVVVESGKRLSKVQVETFGGELTPDLFMIRLQQPGSFDSAIHPVERPHVLKIDFDAGDGIGGRLARIVFADGTKRDKARTMSYNGLDGTFSVVVPGGGMRENIPAARIAAMAFEKAALLPAEIVDVEDPRAAAAATPTPVPTPAPVGAPPRAPVGEADEDYADMDLDDDGEFDQALGPAMGLSPDMGVSDLDYSDFEEDEEEYDDSDFGSSDGFMSIPFLGWGIKVLGLVVYLVVGSIVGGIYLWWSSRLEQVNDFPIWKAFLAALLISIFPPGFSLLGLRYIPFFGCWAAIAIWYFTTRAIIMGTMEVLEEKAGSVIFTYILIQVGVFLAAIYFL